MTLTAIRRAVLELFDGERLVVWPEESCYAYLFGSRIVFRTNFGV